MIKNNLELLLILVLGLLVGCKEVTKEHYDIAILNGYVIDLETGDITQQDIFITKDRIAKINPAREFENYTSERTVDAKDKFVLPGFWDNHVHFRGGDSLIEANKNFLKLFISNGITAVRDAGGDLTPSVLAWRDAIGSDALLGPTIFTSGPKIDGPQATWAGSLVVQEETDIPRVLDSLQALQTDFVKLYDSKIEGELYIKTIEEAEKRGLITSGHMPFTVELNQTIQAGIDGVEHLYYVMKGCSAREKEITQKLIEREIGFWDAMPLLLESYSDSTAQHTFQTLRENDVFVIPTLHIGETLSYLDEVDHANDPYLQYMGNGIIKTYEGRINSAMKASVKAREYRKELDIFFRRLTKSLQVSGVDLLAGSDSGAYNSYTYPGISLHKELEAMVASGLSPLEALRTSAYNGSRFLKKKEDYGSITVGKISDIVLLNENPLKDITNTQTIHYLVNGNKVYDRKQLDEVLDSAVLE